MGSECGPNYGCGVVFQLSPSSNGWTENVLFSFVDGGRGAYPMAGVTLDSSGNVYGTAITAAFLLTKTASGYSYNTLLQTQDEIEAGLVMDRHGDLYGATTNGGASGGGTAFQIVDARGGYLANLLYSFPETGEPYYPGPASALVMDSLGNLYGTTTADGAYGLGTVFKLSPAAAGAWKYADLHDFTGGDDGYNPVSSLVMDASGTLLGLRSSGVQALSAFTAAACSLR